MTDPIASSAGPALDLPLNALPAGFGRYLRKCREAIGLRIVDAAARAGTNYTYLARLERGELTAPPTLGFLFQLGDVYGLSRYDVAAAAGVPLARPDSSARDARAQIRFRSLVARAKPSGLYQPDAHGVPGAAYYSPWHMRTVEQILVAVEQRALVMPPAPALRYAVGKGLPAHRSREEVEQLRDQGVPLMVWVDDPGFGKFLRKRRKELGLTLAEAGRRYGASHAMIAKLESSRWQKPPTRNLLDRLAGAYELRLVDLMERAGYRLGTTVDVLLGVDTHVLFERMVAGVLQLVPSVLPPETLDHWSRVQKQQVVDMADWLDTRVRGTGKPMLEEILSNESLDSEVT